MKRGVHQLLGDSGNAWLCDMPEHWKLDRLKRTFRILNGSTPKSSEPDYWDGDVPWATPEDLGKLNGDTINETLRMITQAGYNSCGTSIAPAGSLILSTRAPIGHLAIAGKAMCTNQGCRALVFRNEDHKRYYYYLLLITRPQLESWGQGSTFKELSRSKLEIIHLPNPPIKEQNAIADFLDRETERIDSLIAKKERQTELLQEKRTALISHAITKGLNPDARMKDSGIEWLGEIPEHWETMECKFAFWIQLGKMLQNEPESNQDEKIPYLKALNVQWEETDTVDLPEMWVSPSDIRKYSVFDGDLLVCEGGEVGRAGILRGAPEACIIQNALHRVRPKKGNSVRFLMYLLEVASSQRWFQVLCNKATIAHFTGEKFGWLYITVPPPSEQRNIADFLDHQIRNIDSLIMKIHKSINRLFEYRSALISAAVTGQIDLRKRMD